MVQVIHAASSASAARYSSRAELLAAHADVLPDAVVGDLGHEIPAAGALWPVAGRPDRKSIAWRRPSQARRSGLPSGLRRLSRAAPVVRRCFDLDVCFQALADTLGLAFFFEHAQRLRREPRRASSTRPEHGSSLRRIHLPASGNSAEVHARLAPFHRGQVVPDFVGGEAEDRARPAGLGLR